MLRSRDGGASPAYVHRSLKLYGLSASGDAVRAIANVLSREDDTERAFEAIVDAIKASMERTEAPSSVVDLATVEAVVAELSRNDEDVAQESIQVFNADATPKHVYNSARKTFHVASEEGRSVHGPAASKIAMFRERYTMVQQRVLRNAMFAPPVLGTSKREYFEITALESLLGTSGTKYVLAMLVQPEEGSWALEDLTSRVPVDLSEAKITSGMFTETAIVLAQGELRGGVFHVVMMGFPPTEKRAESLDAMGTVDPLGVVKTPQEMLKVKELEDEATDAMFIVLSDVHLDNPKVVDKLRVLFEGFAESVPSVFVFIGSLMSAPFGHGPDDRRLYTDNLSRLADLIVEHPSLASDSQFVFVPGLDDPGSSVLPRRPIAATFTKALRERVSNVTFATNPCRLRFYSQEIVLFRHDLVSKMRRHCVVPPTEEHGTTEITEHLVRTVVDQGHLCPLPPSVQPVHWMYDHVMRLFPLPDVVILADSFESYHWDYEHCTVFNPGPFSDDFSFVAYRPATREAEFSRVDR